MRHLLSAFLLFIMVVAAGVAAATTVIALSFDELVAASDRIVVGHVKSVEGVEKNGRVFTHVHIDVDETWKGNHTPTVKIVHIGGRTEKLATRVSGMPGFVPGERALLFLEQPKGFDHFVVTGLAQGKMSVTADPNGGLQLVPNPVVMHTIRRVTPTADGAPQAAPPITPNITTLEQARARITTLTKAKETTE